MSIIERLSDADIHPTADAVKAFRLGYQAGRVRLWEEQDANQWATIIGEATTMVRHTSQRPST
jgi:hypothetical protein